VTVYLHRGSVEGADCEACPLSTAGLPTSPVVSEFPDDPLWILIGEGPGFNEVRQKRPWVGASGQVVNQILRKIGRPREELYVGNSTLCMPPSGAPVEMRERAAACCKPRLQRELAQFPGKPILTLGAVAARSVIPKAVLDAIDPPDVPKTKKKAQKEQQKADAKAERKKGKAIEKIAERRFYKAIKELKKRACHDWKRKANRKPDEGALNRLAEEVRAPYWSKAWKEAAVEYEQKKQERALARAAKPKKPKKKPIKITDIVGTLFDVDVDGSGVRPVIPAIHPAALLRGGGATIGGSHSPDMAYVNIAYDAGKVDALARGKDIRLKLNVAIEVEDSERAAQLFVSILQEALEEGSIGIDLETFVEDPNRHHALMAYMAQIRVCGLSTNKRSVAVLWELLPPWTMSYFQLALARTSLRFHNGLYDRTVLRARGFILPIAGLDEDAIPFEDSLLAHHAAFPGNSHKLQQVTAQFFGVGPWKSEFRNQEETFDRLATYCAKDTGSTHALVPALTVWIKRSKTEIVYARDRRMSDIASRMHLHGQPVSREVNSQLVGTFRRLARDARRKVEDKAADPKIQDAIKHHLALALAAKPRKGEPVARKSDELEAAFTERYNIRMSDLKDRDWRWKINNSKHIAAFLQAMGASLTQMTDGGAISTKKEVLEELVNIGIVRDILEYRENEKMLDFVWPIFDRFDDSGNQLCYGFADGEDRIHPIWSIHKISGRWAGSEPMGVSNPPREKTKKVPFGSTLLADAIITGFICECGKYDRDKHEGHIYKPKFIEYAYRPTTKRQVVARNGRMLVGFDYAQLEARVIALISGDPFMCNVFATNGDLHKECAREVFPGFDQRTGAEQKQARTVCKTLEYATWYGAADEKVWKGLIKEGYDFKLADVVASLNVLKRKMSYVVAWQRNTIHSASQPPYEIRDFVSGRRRVWPMGQVEASEALNICPQATGAAIMNRGMELMDEWLHGQRFKEAFPIAQIHDAAVFECWEEDADAIAKGIDHCFTYEHTNSANGKTVKFPVDIGIGKSWSEV
jgi:uracil-DNA glycosylase family 4